jgi:hypothetical protein
MNGDWLYEELREYPVEAWRLRAGIDALPPVVNLMPTVVGVWENYKLYLSRGSRFPNGTGMFPVSSPLMTMNW